MKTDTTTTVKHEQILDVAIRRFSHFGVAKTTLTEIADDLGVTKQTLAYYFSDKQSLVFAVQTKITGEYIDSIRQAFDNASSVQQALNSMIDAKATFFEKYYMLAVQAQHAEFTSGNSVQSWRDLIHQQEQDLLAALFKQGIDNGELIKFDPVKKAEIFIDTLYAFSRCIKEKGIIPDPDNFKTLSEKQRDVINLFYKALKSSTWKN